MHILIFSMIVQSTQNPVLTKIVCCPIAWGLAQDDFKGGKSLSGESRSFSIFPFSTVQDKKK